MISNTGKKFPQPQIGVGGIIFNAKGEVLMIKRNKKPAIGQWSVPGGCLEAGETLRQACWREVMEETGMDVLIGEVGAVVERRLDGFHYIIIDFVAALKPENPVDPTALSDVSEARWVSIHELDKYDIVAGLKRIIRKIYTALNEGGAVGLKDPFGDGTDFF
ncbi:MAG: NUDIX hydrolase [Gammaproteobacteria bacterium]